jgi:ABC-2 type transport system permease protein
MKNTFRLALTIIKGNGLANFGSDATGRKRKLNTTMSAILLVFFAVYMLAIMTASAFAIHSFLAPFKLQGLMISLYLNAGIVLVFVFGLMMVISVFYHSSDVEKILPLPLRADQITGAKLLVSAVYEYMFFVVMALPALIIYGILEGRGILYYVFTAIVILAMPAVPLCLAAILVMVVMRFTKFARNKDRFSMISSILILIFAMGLSFSMQMAVSFSPAGLSNLLKNGEASIAQFT